MDTAGGFDDKAWSTVVRRDDRVRRAGKIVAWALTELRGFGTGGCHATDDALIKTTGLAAGTIKNALGMLSGAGHVVCGTFRGRRGEWFIVPLMAAAGGEAPSGPAPDDHAQDGTKLVPCATNIVPSPMSVVLADTTVVPDIAPGASEPAKVSEAIECSGENDSRDAVAQERALMDAHGSYEERDAAEAVRVARLFRQPVRCAAEECRRPPIYVCISQQEAYCPRHRASARDAVLVGDLNDLDQGDDPSCRGL